MIELLQRETSKFVSADLWPQNSAILIQLIIKYGGWCRIECIRCQLKCARPIAALDWCSLQSIVNGAIDEWHKRLQACVDEKGRLQACVDEKGRLQACVDEKGRLQACVDEKGRFQACVDEQGRLQACVNEKGRLQACVDEKGRLQACVDKKGSQLYTCVIFRLKYTPTVCTKWIFLKFCAMVMCDFGC